MQPQRIAYLRLSKSTLFQDSTHIQRTASIECRIETELAKRIGRFLGYASTVEPVLLHYPLLQSLRMPAYVELDDLVLLPQVTSGVRRLLTWIVAG